MSGSTPTGRADARPWWRGPIALGLLLVMLAAGMAASGYLYYQRERRGYEEAVRRQLAAIADLKVTQITHWRAERIGDGEILRANPWLAGAVRRWLNGPGQSELPAQLAAWLALFTRHYDYESLALLDRLGRLRFSVTPELRTLDPSCAAAAAEARGAGRMVLSDLHPTGAPGRDHMSLALPLTPPEGGAAPLGVILAQIDARRILYPLVESWPAPSPSAETLLVRREGGHAVYLSGFRHRPNGAPRLKLPANSDDLPAAMVVQGREGIVAGRDYRGVTVLAAVRKVPDSPWYVVAKVDAEEVNAPLRERAWWMVVVRTLLLATAVATAGLLWRDQRARYYRQQYEAELQVQTVLEQSRAQLRALAARLFTLQEDERRRLSSELHDDLNQRLAMLAVQVDTLQQQAPPTAQPVRHGLVSLQEQLGVLSDDIRHLAYQLHPSILEHLGLAVAVKSCCAEFSQREGIPVSFETENMPDSLPQEVALCLYRVVQEALRNLARHSRAAQGSVRLAATGAELELIIADDGVGFDSVAALARGGLGLVSMEERVRVAGGTLLMDSHPGKGTRIHVRVPLAGRPA